MARKRKRNITIRDVADKVGVHHSTVSRALSPDKREKISAAVVEKVEAAAKELGYYPEYRSIVFKTESLIYRGGF